MRFFYIFYAPLKYFFLQLSVEADSSVGFENVNTEQNPTENEYLTFEHKIYKYKELNLCVIRGKLNGWINTHS